MKIKFNLKYGQNGLFVRIWSGNNYSNKKDILVSKNYPKIFEFLGLDYQRWLEGFDEIEDIFDFVTTSHLFDPKEYQLNRLNKINRDRNLKRKNYMLFLDYVKNINVSNMLDNNFDIKRIIEFFPEANIDLHLAQIGYDSAKEKLISMKFNGNIINEKYGLSGKELGNSIVKFKNYITIVHQVSFSKFILEMDLDYIYNTFQQSNGMSSK